MGTTPSPIDDLFLLCNLHKEQFKPADRKACTYGHHPLNLEGQIDIHIKFDKKCICETVYVKMDAPDTLLLSENVCCKLQIVSYHPDVQPVLDHEPGQQKSKRKSKKARIKLIQTIRLPADSSAVVQVEVRELTGTNLGSTDLMLELDMSWHNILMVDDCLLKRDDNGMAPIIVSNTSLSTQVLYVFREGCYSKTNLC